MLLAGFGLGMLIQVLFNIIFEPRSSAPPWAVEIKEMLSAISAKEAIEMTVQQDIADALAKMQTDVTAQTTVAASVQTYVKGIVAQLAALSAASTDTTTAAALAALATQIEANTASDTQAITANTPAASP